MYVAVNETGNNELPAIIRNLEIGGQFLPQSVSRADCSYMAVINDEQVLQLEIVGESASIMLGIRVGDSVVVEWE